MAGLWPDSATRSKDGLPAVDEMSPVHEDGVNLLSGAPASPRRAGGLVTGSTSDYQREQEGLQVYDAFFSQVVAWQLGLTFIVSVGLHILISWGMLTNWNDHEPVDICLFAWAHPAGYSGAPTSIAQSLPIDAATRLSILA